MSHAIGWAASLVLVVTIGYQVRRQWRTGQSAGVSRWLYVGQIVASLGFVLYSVQRDDPVFVVTNSILLVAAGLGLFSVLRGRAGAAPEPPR